MTTFDDTPLLSSSPFKVTQGGSIDVTLDFNDGTVPLPKMTFTGRVTGPIYPLYGSRVSIYDARYQLKSDTLTDGNGNYTMTAELATGKYYIEASADDYKASGYTPIQVYGQNLCVMDFRLTPSAGNGGIYGTASSCAGSSVPFAEILLYDAATGHYVTGGIGDGDGRYTLSGITCGWYYVTAAAAGHYSSRPFAVYIAPYEKKRIDVALCPSS